MNGHPLGPKAITWVNSMLNLCAGGHEICPPVAKNPFPKRILALARQSGQKPLVKVVEKESAQGTYAALSHCWGLELPCVTTVGNHAERLRGIPWAELPQTFQDAIQYCLELGIFYLWIDALCILQDDREDWQIESAKMADIYQNSYLTLAATSSESGSMGCFSKQSIAYQELQLEVQSTEGQVYQILVRRQMPHWVVPPTLLSRLENPLLSRGWAFQERVLSPRVLHFCKQELIWECGQDTVCECGSLPKVQNLKRRFALAARLRGADDDAPYENQGDRSEPSRRDRGRQSSESYQQRDLSDSDSLDEALRSVYLGPKKLARLEAERAKKRLNKATDQWHSIVEQFSALELTKDTDRLPALSGLAERMSPFLGRYLAGLWQESLLRDLGWRVDKLLSGLQKSKEEGRGPSWSWVSAKAKVAFWTEEEITPREPTIQPGSGSNSSLRSTPLNSRQRVGRKSRHTTLKIISSTVRTDGRNPYGEVSSAILLVEGVLKESKVWIDGMVIPDSLVPPSFEVEMKSEDRWLRFPFFADYVLSSDGPHQVKTSDIVFLLMVTTNICLVLSKTSLMFSADTSLFRRIGVLKVPHEIESRYRINFMGSSNRTKVAIL